MSVTKVVMSNKYASPRPSPQPAPLEWARAQTDARITYPDGVPDRLSWRSRDTYTGTELSYRSREARQIISLTSK